MMMPTLLTGMGFSQERNDAFVRVSMACAPVLSRRREDRCTHHEHSMVAAGMPCLAAGKRLRLAIALQLAVRASAAGSS